MNRTKGTCPTCKRKDVTLMSQQPGAQCSVCTRVAGVADKIMRGVEITETDRSTIRRVVAAHAAGVKDSIETNVAERKGWVPLFEGIGAPAAQPVPEWPRQLVAWQCSDGSFHSDETEALRVELSLARRAA